MAAFVSEVEVAADADTAFDFLSDLSNLPKWDPSIRSSEPEDDDGPEVGSRYRVVIGFYGRAIEATYTIVESVRPYRIVVSVEGKVTGTIDLAIAGRVDGSTITYDASASLRGMARLLDKGLKLAFEGIGENVMASLREQLA